ncbi:MAG: TolA-binding protein [Candidatus Omnitrophota bacterium]|jgi:TolA-binding protein
MNLRNTMRSIVNITVIPIVFFTVLTIAPKTAFTQNSEDELFIVTQKSFEDGFYDVAIRYVNQLFEQYPQTDKRVQANLLLGQCYFFKNQYLKAFESFNALLDYTEYRDATLFWLGETHLKGSDLKKAIHYYKQLIQLYPESIYVPQAYYSLGWVNFESNNFVESQENFHQLINKYPKHQLVEDSSFKFSETLFNQQKYKEAITQFKKYTLTFPKSTKQSQTYFYLGDANYYLENYTKAIDYFQRTIEISHDSKLTLMSHISIGWSYLKTEQYKIAENYFNDAEAFAINKNLLSDDVYLGKATLYGETNETEKALEAYITVIKNFPDSTRIFDALLGEANIQYILKKYPDAIKSYKSLITRITSTEKYDNDIHQKASFGLAWAYLKSGDIDACINAFIVIKNKTTNNTVKISALTQIGDAYQDINQLLKAITVYDQILKDFPDSPFIDYVQYRQGIALLKNENIEEAKLSFQSLKSNFPNSKYLNEINYYLAVANFKQENWLAAKKQINTFISTLSYNSDFLAEAYHISALSSFNLSQFNDALKQFQYILKNFPHQSALIKSATLNIAKCFYKLNNTKEALKKFSQITAKYPNSEIAQESSLWLADYYLESKQYDTAISHYTKFLKTYPSSPKKDLVYFELGQSYYAKDDLSQAINTLKKVSEEDRELFVKAKLIIAEIFSQDLSSENAIATYNSIIASSPEFKRNAHLKLASIYKTNMTYTQAMNAYKEALTSQKLHSDVTDAEIQFLIGDLYEISKESNKAIEEYLKISYLYENETTWIIKSYLRVGRVFEDSDQWEKAKTIYQKVIKYETEEAKFAEERIQWINANAQELNNN